MLSITEKIIQILIDETEVLKVEEPWFIKYNIPSPLAKCGTLFQVFEDFFLEIKSSKHST